MDASLIVVITLNFLVRMTCLEPIELVPKMVRWPTHIDHYLCRQLHKGMGIRAHAVTNLSGDLCRTYCRVIDRMGGKIVYTENVSPNFVRCGPFQARCVDGNCVGFNFPTQVTTPPTSVADNPSPEGAEENLEAAGVAGSENSPDNEQTIETTSTSPDSLVSGTNQNLIYLRHRS